MNPMLALSTLSECHFTYIEGDDFPDMCKKFNEDVLHEEEYIEK
jgi:hypothetical protein